MLANEPESDEWNLVDPLPKSLKSLTIQANRAQWPLTVERVEELLQDNHDAMNSLGRGTGVSGWWGHSQCR